MPLSSYPGAIDTTLEDTITNSTVTQNDHATQHNTLSDAIVAIETTLGINPQGSFTDVVTRLGHILINDPGADQIITPTGDYEGISVQASSLQNTHNLISVRNSSGVIKGYWDKVGNLSAASLLIAGSALAASNLSNGTTGTGAVVLAASPVLTGSPTAPTPSPGDSSTKIATTAFVANFSASGVGTLAARPAASAAKNSFYYATDQAVQYISDGTTWYRQGLPAGATTFLLGAAASVPTGWVRYDGGTLAGSTGIYADLYAHLGNTTTLPDTRARKLLDYGTNAAVNTIGQNDGITIANRRSQHHHTVNDPGHYHTSGSGGPGTASGSNGGPGTGNTGTATTGITVGAATTDSLDTSPFYVGLLIAKL